MVLNVVIQISFQKFFFKYIYLIHKVNLTDFTAFKFTQYVVCNIVTQIKLSRA